MTENTPGRSYTLHTAEGFPAVEVNFCFKDTAGVFQDGLTNEELINCLEARFVHLVKGFPTTENINVLTHIRQVKWWAHARNHKKLQSQKGKNDNSSNGLQLQSEGRQVG